MLFVDWSIILPSIITYLTEILGDEDKDEDDLQDETKYYTYALIGFVFMQFLVTIFAGTIMTTCCRSFNVLLSTSCFLLSFGNLLYGLAHPKALNSVAALVVGRMIAGVGAGGTAFATTFLTMSCNPGDKMKVISNYRAVCVLAAVFGPAIGGIFMTFSVNVGNTAFPLDGNTMPGLFSSLCFAILGPILYMITGEAGKKGAEKKFQWNDQTMLFLVIVTVCTTSAATFNWTAVVIMSDDLGMTDQAKSLVFTFAAMMSLSGTFLAKQKKLIFFDKKTKSFNGYPLLMFSLLTMFVGIFCIYLATKWALQSLFIVGYMLGSFAYSCNNTSSTSWFSMVLNQQSKVAMMPFISSTLAVSKITGQGVTYGEKVGQGWDLVFNVWMSAVLLLMLLCTYYKRLLGFSPELQKELVDRDPQSITQFVWGAYICLVTLSITVILSV